jgi:hypothetical protein
MKTMRYLLSLGAVLILAGCATTFRPWSLSEVTEGMDRSAVIELLGEPDYVFMKDGAEYLRYTYQEDFSPSSMPADLSRDSFMNDTATLMQLERSMEVTVYDVILVDGKVMNYKEVMN